MAGAFRLLIHADNTWEHIYRCDGQSYEITEVMCNARQARGWEQCRRCTVRRGGKNDPRAREEAAKCHDSAKNAS